MAAKDLIPMSRRSKDEVKRIASIGGKHSGETRRKRKTMREMMDLLLSLPVNETNKSAMKSMGIEGEENQTNTMLVAVGLLKRAVSGDPRAVEVLCGIAGDIFTIPSDQQEQESAKETMETLKDFEIQFVDASTKGGDNEND